MPIFVSMVVMLMVIIISVESTSPDPSPAQPVSQGCPGGYIETEHLCVKRVSKQGFGDITNKFAFSMTEFNGSVYVGTLNAKNAPTFFAAFFLGLPFLTKGAQIWRGDIVEDREKSINGWIWTRVVTNGLGHKLNYGVRKLTVAGEYIYGVTANHVKGFEIWRRLPLAGEVWEVVECGGFGDKSNLSGRGLAVFDGFLYVGVENRKTGAKIFRRALAINGDFASYSYWEEVISDGFGNKLNFWVSDFAVLRVPPSEVGTPYLYTGTLNALGMEVYRTTDGVNWQCVFKNGNGFPGNSAAMTLYTFKNRLYIGTMNFFKGASLWFDTNPAEGDHFITSFIEGNGNRHNFYVWSMQGFGGTDPFLPAHRLYVGTLDGSGDGFDLFSNKAPNEGAGAPWVTETSNGFGYGSIWQGVRSMTVIGDKLMLGDTTASKQHGCIIFEAIENPNPPREPSIYNGTRTVIGNDQKIMENNNNNNTYYNESIHYYMKQMVCKDMDITLKQIDRIKQFCAN